MSAAPEIRAATEADLPAILRIYNEAVLHTTATFDVEPKTLEDRRKWLKDRKPEHPVVVAIEGDTVLGWASISPWSDRYAYRITGEPSIYVDAPHRGKGLGRQLLARIIQEADRLNFRSLISRVDATNALSIELHLKTGFQRIGVLHESGYKFGKLISVDLLQRMNPSWKASGEGAGHGSG